MNNTDFIQFNCNGLRAQYHQVALLIKQFSPKFIALQELKATKNTKISFNGYHFIRKHPSPDSALAPSIGLLIKFGVKFKILDTPEDSLVIGIDTFCKTAISLFCYYDNRNINKLSVIQLNKIIGYSKKKSIILGDFNARNAIWDKSLRNDPRSNQRGNIVSDFLDQSEYVILNDGSPTRISPIFNQSNTAIDLSIVHKDLYSSFEWSVATMDYGSDHLPIFLSSESIHADDSPDSFWDFKKTDWDCFNRSCHLNQMFEDPNFSIDELDEKLTSIINYALSKSTPLVKPDLTKRKKPKWWDSNLQDLKREKIRTMKLYLKNQTKVNLTQMKRVNCQFKVLLKKNKVNSWETYIDEMNGDMESGDLWKRLRILNRRNQHRKIENLLDENGINTDDPNIIVNRLANFYKEVSSEDNISISNLNEFTISKSSSSTPPNNIFPEMDIDFNIDELEYAISNTHDSAPGIDKIKYCVFKHLNNSSLFGLLKFYNLIWNSSTRPSRWGLTKVISIPKIMVPDHPSQTRPIHLFSTIPKLYDKMLNNRLVHILESNKLLDENQFGFRKNKQTLTSLLKLDNRISSVFANRDHLQLISFDIHKAFDKIWPQTIFQAFHRFGIGGRMFSNIRSFFIDRRFFVQIGTASSDIFHPDIGVPQGSPISSTLFLIAFQGILDVLKEHQDIDYAAYADDLIIYTSNKDNKLSHRILQKAIDGITTRGHSLGIKFSFEKTNAIHFCKKRFCRRTLNTLEGQKIKEIETLRYLGILFNRKGSFTPHITSLRNKLSMDLNLIKILSNSKYGLNQDLMGKIVNALVISKVKYGIEIYSNTGKTNILTLDRMLNRFKRLITLLFITTPIESLSVISGIPDMDYLITRSNIETAIRMISNGHFIYSEASPTVRHLKDVQEFFYHPLGLNGIINLPLMNTTFISPITPVKNQIYPDIFGSKKDDLPNNIIRAKVRDFIDRGMFEKILFTDGSRKDNSTSYAVVSESDIIYQENADNLLSIYTAEAAAILSAVEFLDDFPQKKCLIVSDSKSVVDTLFHPLKKKKNEIINRILINLTVNISILWVPSHVGIVGNEKADEAADIAHNIEMPPRNLLTAKDLLTQMGKYLKNREKIKWNRNANNKLLANLRIPFCPAPVMLNKYQQKIINRLRVGHTNLTHVHKINKSDPPSCTLCGEELTVQHIFSCQDPSAVQSRMDNFNDSHYRELLFAFDYDLLQHIIHYIDDMGYLHQI